MLLPHRTGTVDILPNQFKTGESTQFGTLPAPMIGPKASPRFPRITQRCQRLRPTSNGLELSYLTKQETLRRVSKVSIWVQALETNLAERASDGGESRDSQWSSFNRVPAKNYGVNYGFSFRRLPQVTHCSSGGPARSYLRNSLKKKKPPEVSGGFKLGAGVGFEPTTFRL